MHYFLGFEIHQENDGIFFNQKKYATDLLKKFRMNEAKSVPTPLVANLKLVKDDGSDAADATLFRSIIGSLLYLSTSHPDLMFAASYLSRFMQSPSQIHLCAAKRVLRYVKGTVDFSIRFVKNKSSNLQGFCDSDWTGSIEDSKSTSGFSFSFGSGVFAWNSKKQEVVAQSSAEAVCFSCSGQQSSDLVEKSS
ncbi:hypothetical protein MLD38_037000 [Melastoma candidum]|uniref:Uncharacterized protein n=1 Tax=Melastoma candidum TaxID=119954 RepID=A0ACB9LLU1_9MYRT|nr:hypothetical protein MLD38_037000 [Melastoma candidum]